MRKSQVPAHSLSLLLTLLLVLPIQSSHTVDSESVGRKSVEWQILTKANYSPEIRRHPNLLLMVTVPCLSEETNGTLVWEEKQQKVDGLFSHDDVSGSARAQNELQCKPTADNISQRGVFLIKPTADII